MKKEKQEKKQVKKKSPKMELIESLKLEIASELGIVDQIEKDGWHSLSPRVSGKIGGILSQKLKRRSQ